METLGVFVLGFFVLDIYLFAKYKMFRWSLESDFTAAITIMNNSFKSGRSITQAIEIVGEEAFVCQDNGEGAGDQKTGEHGAKI